MAGIKEELSENDELDENRKFVSEEVINLLGTLKKKEVDTKRQCTATGQRQQGHVYPFKHYIFLFYKQNQIGKESN
jgi:hypothetical protein